MRRDRPPAGGAQRYGQAGEVPGTGESPGADAGHSTLGLALQRMLNRAHTIAPDRLPDLGHAEGDVEGLTSTRILLTDYSGRRLVPFGTAERSNGTVERSDGATAGNGSIAVEGSVAGRCYAQGEPLEIEHEEGVTLYVPLVDGIDRLGVVQFDLESLDRERREVLEAVAALLATEIVARGQYCDAVARGRRLEQMTLAAELQWGLLPPSSFATSRLRVAAGLEPAYRVAGDAYDYAYDGGLLRAAVFDAMGHDLPATMICGVVVGAYRNARRRGMSLGETVAFLDGAVRDHVPDGGYATGILVELDEATGDLEYASAGHPAPLLLRDGRVVGSLGERTCFPLGLGDLAPFGDLQVARTRLQPGDRVLLYSDGIVEAHAAGDAAFGADRLGEFLAVQLASGLPDFEVTRRLIHAIVDHYGGRLGDDATLILVQYGPERTAAA